MLETNIESRIKELKKIANIERIASKHLKKLSQTEAQEMALKLDKSRLEKLELADNLKKWSRLNTLSVYSIEIVKRVRKGENRTYTYWYASWRFNKKIKNVYIGPINKLNREDALKKAYMLKAKDLGIDL